MKTQKSGSRISGTLNNICIAALVMGAAIFFPGCENDLEKIKAFSSTENLPVIEARDFETLFTDSGQIRFFLKAPLLLRFEQSGKEFFEFPEGMELVKFNDKNEVVSSITSDYAKQFVKEQMWEAKNNVVATNSQGDTLKTEHLIWEEKEEKIHTQEFVKIIRPDQIITGVGFTSDQEIKNWKIKDLKGTIMVSMDDKNQRPDSPDANPELNEKENVPLKGKLQFEN